MDQDGNVEIWDFTIPDPPKRFRVHQDGEVFEAPPVLGPRQLVCLVKGAKEIAKLISAGDEEAMINGIAELFEAILTKDSAPKFIALLNDGEKPIDINRQLLPILYRLMESYGLRPTQPSPASSTSPSDAGVPSTDGAPPAESTPSNSLADVSST